MGNIIKDEELLTYQELADKLKLKVGYVQNLTYAGKIPHIIVGDRPRFYLSEVLKAFNENRTKKKKKTNQEG